MFTRLQGLKLVPFGLALIVMALFQAPPYPFEDRTGTDITIPLVAWLAALAGWVVISRWYRRSYGEVRPRARLATLAGAAAFVVAYAAADAVVAQRAFPIDLRGIVVAGGFAAIALAAPRLRGWYYAGAALVLLIITLLPLTGTVSPEPLFGPHATVGRLIAGVALILCGLLDHRLLSRSLHPIAREAV
jgi:hypothetical protein